VEPVKKKGPEKGKEKTPLLFKTQLTVENITVVETFVGERTVPSLNSGQKRGRWCHHPGQESQGQPVNKVGNKTQ